MSFGGYGPDGRERAVVLSFDNLGEAAEMQRGTWPAGAPRGRHPSVVEALPRLLDELDALGLRATFFVEAINCELNPDGIRDIIAHGHELGVHGWCHEPWAELAAGEERDLLERATAALAGLGPAARGFRPPGGEQTRHTPGLLRELGYAWCSPAGEECAVSDGLALLPFAWTLVDAFWLMQRFGPLRVRHGLGEATVPAESLADRLVTSLRDGHGLQTIVLHPFLMLEREWWDGARRVLELLAMLRRDRRAWVVAGEQLASWVTR